MGELLQLAERCEQATGPDRTLERDIALATGWSEYSEQCEDDYTDRGWFSPDGKAEAWHPFYTRSLDAAMTLVPEGAHCGMGQDAGPEGKGWAWVRCKVGCQWQEFSCEPRFVANMTLALCAAALRARAAQ